MVKVTIKIESGDETWEFWDVKPSDFEKAVKYWKECLNSMPVVELPKPVPPKPDEEINHV